MERIGVFFFLFLHRFPEQGSRGSLMDLDFYELTYMIVLLIKDDHLVLAGSSEQLLTGTFRESFYQNLESLAYIPQVTFLGQLICKSIIPCKRRTFSSSGTLSSKWLAAYVPGRSEYLNKKALSYPTSRIKDKVS